MIHSYFKIVPQMDETKKNEGRFKPIKIELCNLNINTALSLVMAKSFSSKSDMW